MTIALPAELLAQTHGVTLDEMLSALEEAEQQGLVTRDERNRWFATEKGQRLRRESLLDLDDLNQLEENAT